MAQYYYIDSQMRQCGPLMPQDLVNAGITRDTMVWCDGMPAWATAGSIPELHPYFQAGPPPLYTNPGKPDNYLVWAILTTLLCCLPFGVVAIIYSSQVDSYWYAGRYDEALNSARKAKNWSIASAVTAVAIALIYFIFAGIVALTAV